MANNDHRDVELHSGDTVVFSATPVPGNERAVNETIDRIYEIGATVVTAKDAPIHASGHGWQEELKLMINLTKPRYVLPIHGDYKRLRLHAELAAVGRHRPRSASSRAATAWPLEIDEDGARFGEDVHAGVIFVDGVNVGDPDDVALRDRRAISADGIFIVVATISTDDGSVVADPEVIFRGVAFLEEAERPGRRAPGRGRGLARGGRRGRHPRAAPDPGRPPRRGRPLRLREAAPPADGAAGRRRGLSRAGDREIAGARRGIVGENPAGPVSRPRANLGPRLLKAV